MTIEVKVTTKEQFSQWVKEYQKLIFTICYSFTKNYFDAEDLTQDTFISFYNYLDKFKGENPKALLTTIAANKCKDYLKSPKHNTNELSEDELNSKEMSINSAEDNYIQKESAESVNELCEMLKEPYRTIAISYFCKNIKLSELSKETGQNLKTLQTQLYRAKKLLKILWKERSA